MKAKKMTIDVFSDPGHGWAKVRRTLLQELGLTARISPFSYQYGPWVYLEEDGDMSLLLQALRERGVTYRFREHTTERMSRIRNYRPYNAEEPADVAR